MENESQTAPSENEKDLMVESTENVSASAPI